MKKNLLTDEISKIEPSAAADELILHDADVEIVDGNMADKEKIAEQVAELERLGYDPKTLKKRKKVPFVRTEAKIGRNEKCTCGSGKKYKHCCIKL